MLFSEILRNSLNYEIRVALNGGIWWRRSQLYRHESPLLCTGLISPLDVFDPVHSLPHQVASEERFSNEKAEPTSWDLESCVLMRNVAAIASLQCTNAQPFLVGREPFPEKLMEME